MADFNFASYCLAGLLREVGFPRKSGLLRRKNIVDASAVDVAAKEMVRIAVGLGAGRPDLAIRLVADAFQDRDWSADGATGATEFIDFLDVSEKLAENPDAPPWQAIALPLKDMGRESIPWEWLGEPGLAVHYVGSFAQGLLWGLLHPDEAREILDAGRVGYEQRAPFWINAGLEISSEYAWPTPDHFYRTCEELVRSFESERRPLVDAPPELLAERRVAERLQGDA